MKLSIIIVSYNVSNFLEQCLLSVQEACKNIVAEIIVVDNNSTDGTYEMISKKFTDIKWISNKNNLGFSKANNQGVDKANGEYILILNPDTIVSEDTFDKILHFAEIQKNLGAIGVKLIDGTGNFLPESKRNVPTIRIANQKIRGNSKNYYANYLPLNKNAEVEILTGAFMLLKRKVYQSIGGFDEDYFMYGEDIDLSYKLLNKGYQNYYFGSTTIIHYKGESTVKDISYLKHFYGAMRIFYKKHFKVNPFYNLMMYMGIKTLTIFKSITLSKEKSESDNNRIKSRILFIGDNQEIFNKIKHKLQTEKAQISNSIPLNIADFDTIIFDSVFMPYKEIIKKFQLLELENISKRIIPKHTNFYIGSDSSTSRGEVVKF